jgi:CRP-like cAMP-binding protein
MRSENSPLPLFQKTLALSPTETEALLDVPVRHVSLTSDEPIVRRGDQSTSCILIVDGMLATSKVVANGRRQITAVHIAGDFPDLMSLHLDHADSDIRSIGRSEIVSVGHAHLRRLALDHPTVGAKLWRVSLVDAAVAREWIANLGQRDAISRMAHVLCEILVRMQVAGLAVRNSCRMPLTQLNLSEVTGVSVVHVNRVLQELRHRNLITLALGHLDVLNWAALVKVADFSSDYLH